MLTMRLLPQHRWALMGVVLLLAVRCLPSMADEGLLRIGMAERDITPPLGFPMAGYYHERLATGARDPLKAKAIVFQDSSTTAAVVVCDLTGIAVDLSQEVRRRASAKTGIPVKNIVVAATHSHTAPDYTKSLYEYQASDAEPGSQTNDERVAYAGKLVDAVVTALAVANQNAQPALVYSGTATQAMPVSFNRRFVMRDGSVRTWANYRVPDVVRAAGPIDDQIGLLLIRQAEGGEPRGVFSNFALHLDTVGGHEWSADYPYYIEQAVRSALGDEVISVFGLGCCGDINHSDPNRTERNTADVIGNTLGATITEQLMKLSPVSRPLLQVHSERVDLPLQDASKADVLHAIDLLAAARSGEKLDFYDHVTAYKRVILDQLRHETPHVTASEHITWGLSRTWQGVGASLPVEVQVITLGEDVAIVCLPGEVFVELGLAIKQASPFRTTMILELSQAVETAYVPTRAAYAGGGYEVTNSTLQPGGGEMLVEAAVRLLRQAATASLNAAK